MSEICTDIVLGEHDESLDEIVEAVKDRRKALSVIRLHSIDKGDVVRVKNISPKYLNGLEAPVDKIERKTKNSYVYITCPDEYKYRNRAGREIGIPIDCIELV